MASGRRDRRQLARPRGTRRRDAAVLPLLPGDARRRRLLPAQVHAVRAAGQLVAAVGRLARRPDAAGAGGRDGARPVVAVAALPHPPQP